MKAIKLVLLLVTALPLFALSQLNYRQGYVIKSNGDTLKGYVNYREWNESPKSIEFKQNTADKQSIEYNALTIKSFKITGLDSYVSYIGPVSRGKTNMSELAGSLDTSVRQDSSFLKVISSGPNVKLLYHADDIKYRYFIQENNMPPVEFKFYIYKDDNDRVFYFSPFIRQLRLLINKYTKVNENIAKNIADDDYKETTFVKYIHIINNNNSNASEESRSSSVRFFGGVAAAYTISTFNGPYGFNYQHTATSVLPSIAIGIDFLSNANIQKSFFRLQASISEVSPTFTGSVSIFSSTQFISKVSGIYVVNLYNTDKFKYFFGVGAAFTVTAVNSKLTATQSGVIISSTQLQPLGNSTLSLKAGDTYKNPYEVGLGGLDLVLKTGILLNKKLEISIEAAPVSFGFSTTAGSPNSATGYTSSAAYSYKNLITTLGINYFF